MNHLETFMQFIDCSPTSYHAVEWCKKMLQEVSVQPLSEKEIWQLEPGKSYYVTRNDSALIAFTVPKEFQGFDIYAAHTDSPCFKLKTNPEIQTKNWYTTLNVEKYGGMILSSWMDRPVSIAGRVVVENDQGELETKVVNLEELTLIIPNLAIHLNRDINQGMNYNVQKDLLPVYGAGESLDSVDNLLAQKLGCGTEQILGKDLYLYSKTKCTLAGVENTLLAGPRLDDLECVFAGIQAFCQVSANVSDDTKRGKMIAVFDNEEVGSSTKQGAGSTFLQDVMKRLRECLGWSEQQYQCVLADSVMISADNAHGLHPNYPEKSDPTHQPLLNQGIVMKYHGGQNYTTDAWSEAWFKKHCKQAGISYQTYCNRSDLAGGSTLGKIAAANLSIPMIDIGLAQLSMHSAYELSGTKDLEDLIHLMEMIWGDNPS